MQSKMREPLIVMLVGIVVLGGLGYLAVQVIGLHGRVCTLEAHQRANLEERITAIERDVAVIKAISTRVDVLSARVATLSPTTGHILAPRKDNVVSTAFRYEIEINNPSDGKYYYLANRIGGLYWPKVRINTQPGKSQYSGTTDEGGSPPGGHFTLFLFEVGQDMHLEITRWLNGYDFRGIQIDGRVLDSVDVVKRR